MREYFFKTLKYRLIYSFGIIVLIFSVFVLRVNFSTGLLFVCLFLLFLLIIMFVNICILSPVRFTKDRRYQKVFTLSYNENGVELRSEDLSSQIHWQYFKKVWETKQLYYLFHDKRQFWIVPKSKFASRDQEDVFRELVCKYHQIQTGVNR